MTDPLPHAPDMATPAAGLRRLGIIAVLLAAGTLIGGAWVRLHQAGEARADAAEAAVPTVQLIRPEAGAPTNELILPGTLAAWTTAHIYPRVGGYVRSWVRDIGAQVADGAPLATIDTPELDQQIIQARATLGRAQTEADLARTTAARWNDLLHSHAVSAQETDEKNAGWRSRMAAVVEARAALGRLLAMKAYAVVRAPFAGIVTQRNADIGDLVGPGSGASNPAPMFAMVDERRLRVFVNVPQQYSAAMQPGITATLHLPDWPGRTFAATLTDQSHAIDPRSGALQVQLVADNPTLALKPGGYAEVHFALPGAVGRLVIPAGALLLRAAGSQVASVTADGRVHLLAVTVGRDLGGRIEITGGLAPTTRIIDNPTDSLAEGQQVNVVTAHG